MKKALFFAVLTAVFMAPAYASWDRQDTEKHEKSSHTDIDKRNEGRGYYKGGYEQAYDIKNYNYNRYKKLKLKNIKKRQRHSPYRQEKTG
jgi:hypothetical protein